MSIPTNTKQLIERPDGSTIEFEKLDAREQLAHDLVSFFCGEAEKINTIMTKMKRAAISELVAHRTMMLEDYGVKIGGKEGNLTLRSADGRLMVKLTVSKHITFGPQLEAAKALIDEFIEAELDKGGSQAIREIIEKVFKINGKGRVDTAGILGLREHRFENPIWERAMAAIEEAICRDGSTTYVNFYTVDPHAKNKEEAETRIPLDLAKL